MKRFLWLLLFLCPYVSDAQSRIRVGDKVPDILFKNVLNFKSSKANLYGFKGALTLLDFWAGYCSACIHKIPLLDSMQKACNGQLNVLLVSVANTDTRESTGRIIKRLQFNTGRQMQLPIMLGDTMAASFFPFRTIPHYIWIDAQHKVVAITGTDDVTPENILQYLQGKPVAFNDSKLAEEFDITRPLFTGGNAGNGGAILTRSTFSGYIPGMPARSSININKSGMVTKITKINQPLSELLMLAWQYNDKPDRFVYSFADTLINPAGKSDVWLMNHSYAYELITPPVTMPVALNMMQQDIRRAFGISARRDSVMTACYVLEADTNILSRFNSAKNTRSVTKDSLDNYVFEKSSLAEIVGVLDDKLELKVVDETHFLGLFDIILPDTENKSLLQSSLGKYGLRLVKAERKLMNLIIYQTN